MALKWENKTILIVEDDDMSYEYLVIVLKKAGLNILRAETGVEAIEIIKGDKPVDIIFMDLQLPMMGGIEASGIIHKLKPDIPIVAQTANELDEKIDKCLQAGCVDYVAKPIRKNNLLKIIEKYIN